MPTIQVSTNGSGAGTGTSDIGVHGYVRGIKITLNGSHTDTDVTITEVGGLGRTILSVTGLTASTVYNPENTVSESDGVVITDVTRAFYVSGTRFLVTVTGGPNNTANAVQASIIIDPRGA